MAVRTGLALLIIAVVALIAMLIERRRPRPGPTITGNELPSHLDRSEFVAPDASWLVAVFSSATCLACADVWSWVQSLESSTAAVQGVEVKADPALHQRYAIDSVPATLVADSNGVVRYEVLGPLSENDKNAIMALVGT